MIFTKSELINQVYGESCYLEFGNHENLKALACCPFASDEKDAEYNEITFAVPVNWLKRIAKEMFGVDDINKWLDCEYTSDESEEVLHKGIMERKIVFIHFD